MSLLHLVHKNVIIKFADVAKNQYNPQTAYAFRLTGVDGMGFLQIQDLKPSETEIAEPASDAYWINKDIIREIQEVDLATTKVVVVYTGKATKPAPVAATEEKAEAKIESAPREVAPKLPKAKVPAKKSVLKSKPVFN
jgi:hypothetical protein